VDGDSQAQLLAEGATAGRGKIWEGTQDVERQLVASEEMWSADETVDDSEPGFRLGIVVSTKDS
jgi:hypothetical protein